MPPSESNRLALVASDNIANDAQKRRKNVGTACLACKSRKLKCTGAPPCTNCVKSSLQCTLDETADRRRRGALKRKIDQLEDKQDLLDRILDALRESDNRNTVLLLNLIRSHASLAEIRFYIEHQLPRSELTATPELMDIYRAVEQCEQSEPPPKRRILDTRRPSNVPRFSVPARPWTSIIADDALVSRLVSLWFTWVHPFYNWINRDLFIRDMKSGSLSAQYCSPFLLNIILADACAYSEYSATHGLSEDLVSKRTGFYDEAKRLLDKEEGRISLPTVQGLGVLWKCASITGRDRQGWISRGHLAYSLRELSQTSSSLSLKSDAETICMAQAVDHTKWGLFNLAMIHALFVKKPLIIGPPLQSYLPPISHHSHQCDPDQWYSYPNQSTSVGARTSCLFNAVCHLNRIAYNLGPVLFSQGTTPLPRLEIENEKLEALQELTEWPDRLPRCLAESNVDVPHVLSMHMYYHTIMTAVYGFLRTQPVYTANRSTWSPKIRSLISDAPYDFCLSSAHKIAQLVLVHRSNWGFDRMPGAHVHCIMAALFTLLEALDGTANRDAFISLIAAASAFSRRWECTKGLLRTLRDAAQERGIALPVETDPFLADLDQLSEFSTPGKSETPEFTPNR
ncbi:hypothetical protein BDW59DRAFT_92284 [Aspergillus cavernicola]|uniref:Zn(2)-C6 fungal-type domain-containing protein n=1 Tax=Aspergillus cavernicola TaxID=176166 RepID=A0ABR4I7R2_9EURO